MFVMSGRVLFVKKHNDKKFVNVGKITFVMSGTIPFAKDRTIMSVNGGTITFIMRGTTTFVKSRKGGTIQFVKTGTIMFVEYNYKQYQKDISSSVQYGRLFTLSDGSNANNGLKKNN